MKLRGTFIGAFSLCGGTCRKGTNHLQVLGSNPSSELGGDTSDEQHKRVFASTRLGGGQLGGGLTSGKQSTLLSSIEEHGFREVCIQPGRIWLQAHPSSPVSGCFSAGESAQVGKAFRLDLHLAGDTPFSGGGHGYQVVFSESRLHLFEPFRIDWFGAVNHQEPHQIVFEPFLGHQTIAGKDILCSRMPEEIKLASSWDLFGFRPGRKRPVLALVHMAIISRAASVSLI